MADSFLLLESGDYLLQEDGSSKIILEVGASNLIALHRYQRHLDDVIIYEDALGNVVAATGYGAPSRTVISVDQIIGVYATNSRGTTLVVYQDGTGAVTAAEF